VKKDPAVPDGSVGTERLDAPVTREDFERALRAQAIQTESVREDLIQLAAQVVALQTEIDRRLAPGLDAAVQAAIPEQAKEIRIVDDRSTGRLNLADCEDKYTTPAEGPDCTALLPICKGRCCTLHFALSTQDLDEGVIRWDYGKPYAIRQRIEDGYCTHNHPTGRFCTVYHHRPRPCRQYDCRKDARIWADFDARVLAEESPFARKEQEPGAEPTELDLLERLRQRQVALAMETFSLGTNESARRRHERAELESVRPAEDHSPSTRR